MLNRPALRPLDLSDLLDTTFALYRANFALFAGIVAILTVPEAIINALVTVSTTPSVNAQTGTVSVNWSAYIAGNSSSSLLGLVFSTLITGALAVAVSRRYLGSSVTIGEAYRAVGTRGLLTLLGAGLLSALLVVVGLFIVIVGAIIVVVKLAFVPQAIILERRRIWDGIQRSWRLTNGSFWRVFGIGFVLYLIVGIAVGIVGGVAGAALTSVGGDSARVLVIALTSLATIVVDPIRLVGFTLLYYDLRIRKEGFDLEYMARLSDAGGSIA